MKSEYQQIHIDVVHLEKCKARISFPAEEKMN